MRGKMSWKCSSPSTTLKYPFSSSPSSSFPSFFAAYGCAGKGTVGAVLFPGSRNMHLLEPGLAFSSRSLDLLAPSS